MATLSAPALKAAQFMVCLVFAKVKKQQEGSEEGPRGARHWMSRSQAWLMGSLRTGVQGCRGSRWGQTAAACGSLESAPLGV